MKSEAVMRGPGDAVGSVGRASVPAPAHGLATGRHGGPPHRGLPSSVLAWLAALLVLALLAPVARADELDNRARQIAKQLQCPVCESVSVADSPSELATQMRGIVRTKLEAGESEQQIIQYFVDRYGDQVLVEPPKRGLSLAVWIAPVLVLAGGAMLLLGLLRSWLAHPSLLPDGEGASEGKAASPPRASGAMPLLPLPLGEAGERSEPGEGRPAPVRATGKRGEPSDGRAQEPNGHKPSHTFVDLVRRELETYRREVGQ